MDKKVAELLKLTSNYDPDQQYMAIRQLAGLVDLEAANLKPEQLSTIIDTILKFLGDTNKDLQGIAIDCLSKMITKLPPQANNQICSAMIGKLSDVHTAGEFRGIYATALNSIIKSVSVEYGIQLKELLGDCIRAAMNTVGSTHPASNKIQELLIEVVDAFISKWPTMIAKLEINRIEFAKLLLNNIIRGSTASKANASMLCLGRYSATLRQDELEQMLFKGGLVSSAMEEKDDHKKKTALFALKFILQNPNREQQRFNGELLDFLFKSIRFYKNDKSVQGDTDRLEVVCDILEQLLLGVLYLVENFPKDARDYITRNNSYQRDVSELVSYNPAGRITYLADKIEVEEEDEYYDDEQENDDDGGSHTCRVRIVVTSLIGRLCRLDNFLVDEFIGLIKLYDRLMETNIQVREAAFETFNRIVHCVTVEENTKKLDIENVILYPIRRTRTKFKEVANEFLEHLVKKLKELTGKNTIDQKSVLECSRLLLAVCKSFAGTISKDQQLVPLLFPLLERELKRSDTTHDTRANILEAFSYLFMKEIEDLKMEQYLKLMIDSLDTNSEVSLAAFKSIDNILEGRAEYFRKSPIIRDLIKVIHNRLTNNTYKADARKALLQCASHLLSDYSHHFTPETLHEYLKELNSKLLSETAKKAVLIALTKINTGIPLCVPVIEILNRTLLQISSSLINHQNASVAESAQEAVGKLIEILKNNFSKENAIKLVDISRTMRGVIPRYMDSVLNIYPEIFKNYLNELFNADEIPVHTVATLLSKKVVTQADCLQLLKKRQKTTNLNNIVSIVAVLGLSESDFLKDVGDNVWGRVALRCIGEVGHKKHFELLQQYALGKYEPETNAQASIALGSLCSKHFKEFANRLLGLLGTCDEEHMLNVYIALKEAVVRSGQENYGDIDKMFEHFLNEIAAGRISKQAYLNLISECIAKQVLLNPTESERLLNFLYHSEHVGHKYLFATMFRFLEEPVLTDEYLRPKISQLIKLQTDTNVNIKTEALKSLTHLTIRVPHSVMMCVNEDLIKSVKECSLIDEKLIKEQNIVVKILIDYGKPMRKQAFTFLETALESGAQSAFESMYPSLLSIALEGLDKERELIMVVQRLNLIKVLTKSEPHVLVTEGHRYRTSLEPRIPHLDTDDKITSTLVRSLYEINRNMKKEFNVDIEELYQSLLKRADLKELAAQIDKEFN